MTGSVRMSMQALHKGEKYLRYAANFGFRSRSIAEVTHVEALMFSLTVMWPVVQTALDAQKMTRRTLRRAKLDVRFEVHTSALEGSS
jgi:hypothetical protein